MALDPIQQTACPIPLRLGAIRGDSIDIRLRLVNVRTGRPIVLTGWSGEASIWSSTNADVALHSLTVTVDQAASGQPTTGMVAITAAPTETTLWPADAFWSLVMIAAGVRKTITAGPWALAGRGYTPTPFACGLSVCAPAELERIGADCLIARVGYQDLALPYPQAQCTC